MNDIDRDTHDHDLTYENEQSTVTIPLKEYDKLKSQGNYITDPSLISIIDKLEEHNMSEQNQIEDIKFNGKNLYKEESFTDLEVGTIRKLTPIHPDGTEDNERKASFTATTNIMTPSGALPLNGEIEADSLESFVSFLNDQPYIFINLVFVY